MYIEKQINKMYLFDEYKELLESCVCSSFKWFSWLFGMSSQCVLWQFGLF